MACKHSEDVGHDCEYVDARNSLLPAAEAHANATIGTGFLDAASRSRWTRAFLAKMDELVVAAGIVKRRTA